MTTSIQLEALFIREIDRCYRRINECETREAELGAESGRRLIGTVTGLS